MIRAIWYNVADADNSAGHPMRALVETSKFDVEIAVCCLLAASNNEPLPLRLAPSEANLFSRGRRLIRGDGNVFFYEKK